MCIHAARFTCGVGKRAVAASIAGGPVEHDDRRRGDMDRFCKFFCTYCLGSSFELFIVRWAADQLPVQFRRLLETRPYSPPAAAAGSSTAAIGALPQNTWRRC